MLTKQRSLLARLLGDPACATLRRHRRRIVARLECLEDRAVPSTFTVTTTLDAVNGTDGKLSLREAVSAANAPRRADTIVVPAGVYRLTRAGADDSNAAGDLDVTGTTLFRGAGQVRSRRWPATGPGVRRARHRSPLDQGHVPGPDHPQRPCRGRGRGWHPGGQGRPGAPGLRCHRQQNHRLRRRHLQHRAAGDGGRDNRPQQHQPQHRCRGWRPLGPGNSQDLGSVLTVNGSTIRHNIARDGGGIFAALANMTNSIVGANSAAVGDGGGLSAATTTLTNCTVSGNTAADEGGGIYAGTVTLTNCTVSRNAANSTVGGMTAADGGGISAVTATLYNSTLSNNTAADGGGIIASVATLTNCNVRDNTATTSSGGGIVANVLTLSGSTVSGNSANAGDGGGIRAVTVTLTNSTVNDNTAGNGGGILAFGTATLTNCTVSGNHAADQGGGILAFALRTCSTTPSPTMTPTRAAASCTSTAASAPPRSATPSSLRTRLISTAPAPTFRRLRHAGHNLVGDGSGRAGFSNGAKGDHVGTAADPIDPGSAPWRITAGPP